jgi:hypothetical protein
MIPLWKRPEIVKLFISRLNIPHYMETRILFLISPEDPFYKANLKLIKVKGFDYLNVENDTLGRKKNIGLNYALHWKWDFFTELGSDNIINPNLWQLYEPYFNTCEYFGINSAYSWEPKTDKAVQCINYHEGNAIGPARVIKRNVIEDVGRLWRNDWNCGMDGCSHFEIEKRGYKQTVIDVTDIPYILDIKTATNINAFFEIEDMGVPVDVSFIKDNFNVGQEDIDQVYFTTIETENFYKRVEDKTQLIGNKKAAFDIVNNEYSMAFGEPKFKSFDSYKSTIYKILKK